MTKARDLANAGTALTTVDATELGYLNGVTSAVQTQLDAKIAKTLTTTTGDIIYASGANTPARLGIGSTDQVLKVTAGVPAWGTASSPSYTWTTYTPTLSNLTIGNGNADFKYVEIGNLVVVMFQIVWGSTTSTSGGAPGFTAPVTVTGQGLEGTYGSAVFRDSGTDAWVGHVGFDSPRFYLYTGEIRSGYTAPKNLSSTIPFTHTTNDAWRGYFIVQKA